MLRSQAGRHYYLGRMECPGPLVCKPEWIGNGHCDDCFGCEPLMVAAGVFGDCSACNYFWSSGRIDRGVFDGGDCDGYIFPSAVVDEYFDACLNAGGVRMAIELEAMAYREKRNTILLELHRGGWGHVSKLQHDTDMQLAGMCLYANMRQCLSKNSWWNAATMSDWTEAQMRFEAADQIAALTTFKSIQLVHMTDRELLDQCVVAGLHLRLLALGEIEPAVLDAMGADEKRNAVINHLHETNSGLIEQLQNLTNPQLVIMLDYTRPNTE